MCVRLHVQRACTWSREPLTHVQGGAPWAGAAYMCGEALAWAGSRLHGQGTLTCAGREIAVEERRHGSLAPVRGAACAQKNAAQAPRGKRPERRRDEACGA